ncbi:MAG: tRNA1(Val) (adenine(37)-N6)-methyltransferase [Desulfobacteraceae bacterium]|nr:tRNA1(Val) (adenine(37)-N6)-methyltransferase [Desulfobacteraceae bacterium]
MDGLTSNKFLNSRIKISQYKNGYRFSIDAAILASCLEPKAGDRVLDLGTGCGIIPIILALRYPDIHITGVEIQSDLFSVANQNVIENKMQHKISMLNADLRTLTFKQFNAPFNWVVSNPPYRKPNSGRVNPNSQKAIARHEICVNLDQLLACANKLLYKGAKFVIIYPAQRLAGLISRMRNAGLEPKWMRGIHSRADQDAKLILVQGSKAGRPGIRVAKPLIVYRSDGSYTDEVAAMISK